MRLAGFAGFGRTVDKMKTGAEYGTVMPTLMPWYSRPGTAASRESNDESDEFAGSGAR
jgi:hypothetical protein